MNSTASRMKNKLFQNAENLTRNSTYPLQNNSFTVHQTQDSSTSLEDGVEALVKNLSYLQKSKSAHLQWTSQELKEVNDQDISEVLPQKNHLTSDTLFALKVIDALDSNIAVLNIHGVIIAVNTAWENFGSNNGAQRNSSIGINYLKICESVTEGENADDALRMARGLKEVIAGTKKSFEFEYPCHAPFEQRWFCAKVNNFKYQGERYIVVAHENVSFQKKAAEKIQRSIVETHHRVKNNLQLIATLVELNRADTDDPSIQNLLKKVRSHLVSMAAVHDLLTSESKEQRSGIEDTKICSSDLLQKVINSLSQLSERHTVTTAIEPLRLLSKTLGSIAVITNELILNALKYSSQQIHFTFQKRKGYIHFSVHDNGMGFFDGFNLQKHSQTGFQVISLITEYELGGRLFIKQSKKLGGAEVEVVIPFRESNWKNS
jgi:two-component sensor histidine kinase